MKKILTVIGARPQIIKSAALSRAIKNSYSSELKEVIVHTGQHYDEKMSGIFFKELEIRKPRYNLGIGSGSHGKQTAEMMFSLEQVIRDENPNAVVIYGDTNSTLAAALSASKIHIPVVHIEAGLRSFNKLMPEEINRITSDHVSTLLFCPTETAVENLKKEGFSINNTAPFTIDNPKLYHCGDIMYDNAKYFGKKQKELENKLLGLGLKNQSFFLVTFHRPINTDKPKRLKQIFTALIALTEIYPNARIILPLHPRTKKAMENNLTEEFIEEIQDNLQIRIIPPVSYLTMIALEKYCDIVLTDSGGLQKEAYFFNKPCVVLRKETEWVEIVNQGNSILADADQEKIVDAVVQLLEKSNLSYPSFYGDGKAAEFIVQEILNHC